MKFLPRQYEGRRLMPLNVLSYEPFELGNRDAIAIIFKDIATGKKYVETIDRPKYEVYVVKREYWNEMTYMRNWMPMDKLDRHVISYRYRDRELSKILKVPPNEVKYSPLIFGYDINIENYYYMQFLLEYGNEDHKELSVGFLDIENDIIQCDGFPTPGEAPTSAVTYIDGEKKVAYTLALGKDNIPILPETNKHYEEFQQMRDDFYRQVEYFKTHIDDFVADCHKAFDESYGEFEYNVLLFDDELELLKVLWQIVNKSSNDFLEIWNAPYDIRNLIERPLVLGVEPESLICDEDFKYKTCFFEEDTNVLVHKRNHRAIVGIKPTIVDQMVMYAGIRSGRGKLPSVKLNTIARIELKDEKLNYEEEGDIKTFMYKNYWKYILYNLKDVLLQYGIHQKTHDIDDIYSRCEMYALLPSEVFVSTVMLTNSLAMYMLTHNYVLGTNANKILPPFDYKKFISEDNSELDEIMEASMIDPDADDDFEIEDEMDDGYYTIKVE